MEPSDAELEKIKKSEFARKFFETAGRKEKIEIYRIEKFDPVEQDKKYHGKFYTGDSYMIVVNAEKLYDLHFWHGDFATGDEVSSSAIWTVQLAGNLDMDSRQHLELQGHESDKFMSYFKGGIEYMEGGVESGYRHVEPENLPVRLLLVKGKRYPRVFPVEVKADSINDGDVFILDNGNAKELYYWAGSQANINEKAKGMELAINLKTERGKTAELYYPSDNDHSEEFWNILGGKPDKINPAVDDEATNVEDANFVIRLFKVSNSSGEMQLTEIEERPLKRAMLDTNDCFILETYDKVVAWVGKAADP